MADLHDGRDPDNSEVGGEVAGGAGGAVLGGLVGAAIGGPIGAVIGAGVGALAGAKTVDAITSGDDPQTGTEISVAAAPGAMGSASSGTVGAPLGATTQAAMTGLALDAGRAIDTPGETQEQAMRHSDTAVSGYTVSSGPTSGSVADMPGAEAADGAQSSATADRLGSGSDSTGSIRDGGMREEQ